MKKKTENEKRKPVTSVWIPKELADQIKAWCQDQPVPPSMSAVTHAAVREWLEVHK